MTYPILAFYFLPGIFFLLAYVAEARDENTRYVDGLGDKHNLIPNKVFIVAITPGLNVVASILYAIRTFFKVMFN